MASEQIPQLNLLFIFIVGTILMRAAGCIVNDLLDVNFDKHVERTKNRLLVTGEVTKVSALIFLVLLLLLSFILVLQLNIYAILLSVPALFFALCYPLTKRFFRLPQLILGIAFGFGILMSFAAVKNELNVNAWLLFLANIFWALGYDSHYAIADLSDDQNIPIHSSVKTFQKFSPYLILFSYLGMYLALYSLAILNNFSMLSYFFLTLSLLIATKGLIGSMKLDPKINFKAFKNNNYVGFLFFLAFLVENLA